MQTGDITDFEISSHHVSSTSNIHHYYFVQNEGGINIWSTNSSFHALNDSQNLVITTQFMRHLAGATIESPSIQI